MSEAAPSVGGGATIDRGQSDEVAGHGPEALPASFVSRCLTATVELDPLGLQAQLDLATSVLGLARCVDEIVTPVAHELRHAMRDGLDEQDRIATEGIRTWLSRRGSLAPAPLEVGPILLACGPREPHLVDLESLALLLRYRHWPCWVLGARVSTFTLTIAAQAAGATGVVVMSTESRGLTGAVGSLRAIDALGFPLFFAGSAFEPEPVREVLPGRYLGTTPGIACDLVIDTLAPMAAGEPSPLPGS